MGVWMWMWQREFAESRNTASSMDDDEPEGGT
jgi:hypothetical protein